MENSNYPSLWFTGACALTAVSVVGYVMTNSGIPNDPLMAHEDVMSNDLAEKRFNKVALEYRDTKARICAATKIDNNVEDFNFSVRMDYIAETQASIGDKIYSTKFYKCGDKPSAQTYEVRFGELLPRLMIPGVS